MQNNRSYVRSWVGKRVLAARHSDLDVSLENLFVLMMRGLCGFLRVKRIQSQLNALRTLQGDGDVVGHIHNTFEDVRKHYSGDAAFFELGCYLFIRLDLWLHQHNPHRREKIATYFADRFVKLFAQALNSRDIPTLFDERTSQYGKLVRSGEKLDRFHFYLSQLILRTRDNCLLESFDFENGPILITSGFEDYWMKIALAGWEVGILSALLKAIEEYCDLIEPAPS